MFSQHMTSMRGTKLKGDARNCNMVFLIYRWLLQHSKQFDDVIITNETEEYAILSINGPKSRDLLQELTDYDVSEKSFKFMDNKRIQVAGLDVLALCVSYTGFLLLLLLSAVTLPYNYAHAHAQ